MRFVVTEGTYAVFDPLGGVAGERVTTSACDAFRLCAEAHDGVMRALLHANTAVRAAVQGDVTLRGAGCAAGALRLQPSQATVAWAGDVHVFRLRAGDLRALTREHSALNDGGAAAHDLANLSPSARKQLAGVVVRALGMTRDPDVDTRTSPVEPGDVFALLSGGLFDALGVGLLRLLLHEHRSDPRAGVRALLDTGKANGGRGALTVVLVAPNHADPGAGVAARSEVA